MKTTPSPRGRALLHQTPVGAIVIVENGTAVTHVFFSRLVQPEHVEWEETPLLRQTASQLDEYFQGARRMFGGLTIKQDLLELEQGAVAPFMLFPDAERARWNTPASS